MGNSASKFKKHLQRGDEFAVMQLYERHSDIRKSLDANASYGENYSNNTPLHFASLHAMKFMIKAFLTDNGGNPNKRNRDEATSLHLICQIGKRNKNIECKLRTECLSTLLAWQGVILADGQPEKANVDAQDVKKNTPIHYAASSGLRKCVELLVSVGANLFFENENKDTACDLAIKAGFRDLGEYLESQMLFSQECGEVLNEEDLFPVSEPFNGLREQDLREAKDLLLVETADMLHIPLFTAETLLKHHEWSREALIEAWMRDPIACCEKCGVHSKPYDKIAPTHSSNQNSPRRIDRPGLSPIGRSGSAATNRVRPSSSMGAATDSLANSDRRRSSPIGPIRPIANEPDDAARPIGDRVGGACDSERRIGINASADRSVTSLVGDANDTDVDDEEDDPFDYSNQWGSESKSIDSGDEMCQICAEIVPKRDTLGSSECEHRFCRFCWKNYVGVRLQEGEYHGVNCPAFGCSKLVPLELIEIVLSPTTARKFLRFDIKAFVDSNPRIKWCPFPGCTNAVRLPFSDQYQIPVYLRAFPKLQPPPASSRTVTCPNYHSFCWECSAQGHEPTSCEKWKDWHDKIAEIKPEELKDTSSTSEMAANCLWLVTNSKPCPKCKSPIQKNDGCNHMKCSKCKHDFCWVCLGPWKKHSTETGGYFRCNRYDDSRKVDEKTEQAIAEAKEQSKKTYELNRFVHYYARYKNHMNSHELEKPLLNNIESRIENFVKLAAKTNDQPVDFSFIKDSINELLRSRKVLSSSYAYGYFLKDYGYNKTIFEYLQNELEVSVEALSALVGRNYLRGSRQRIAQTTQLVAGRRHRFVTCVARGLLPPETPPGLRKAGRKRGLPAILGLDKDDDDWSKMGFPKVDDYDPLRPWIRDARGKHHNLLAIFDWPEEESEEDSPPMPMKEPVPVENMCIRMGCRKRRAINPRTGESHRYCTLRCQQRDASGEFGAAAALAANLPSTSSSRQAPEVRRGSAATAGGGKYNVDLIIALQMSRLQLLRDLRAFSRDSELSLDSSGSIPFQFTEDLLYGDDEDADLQLAIERSVLDLVVRQHQSSSSGRLIDQLDASADVTSSAADKSASSSEKIDQSASSGVATAIASPPSIDARRFDAYFRKMVEKPSTSSVDDRVNLLPRDDDDAAVVEHVVVKDKVRKVLIKSLSTSDSSRSTRKTALKAQKSIDNGGGKTREVDVSTSNYEPNSNRDNDDDDDRIKGVVSLLLNDCLNRVA